MGIQKYDIALFGIIIYEYVVKLGVLLGNLGPEI
jgi:hypothetical protein